VLITTPIPATCINLLQTERIQDKAMDSFSASKNSDTSNHWV